MEDAPEIGLRSKGIGDLSDLPGLLLSLYCPARGHPDALRAASLRLLGEVARLLVAPPRSAADLFSDPGFELVSLTPTEVESCSDAECGATTTVAVSRCHASHAASNGASVTLVTALSPDASASKPLYSAAVTKLCRQTASLACIDRRRRILVVHLACALSDSALGAFRKLVEGSPETTLFLFTATSSRVHAALGGRVATCRIGCEIASLFPPGRVARPADAQEVARLAAVDHALAVVERATDSVGSREREAIRRPMLAELGPPEPARKGRNETPR